MSEKLQKILARAGYGSRRSNEALIRAGRVSVNGQTATLGDRADARSDRISVDGQEISFEAPVYIMLHKPRNVLSSTEDELGQNRTTVRDLVDVEGHLYPVGRLDRESLGLILLTNDGQLAHRLTHPSYEHPKVYEVLVEGHPGNDILNSWRRGLELDGKMTLPCKIKRLQHKKDTTWLRVTLREGRKRQIRRVAALVGHPVRTLVRTRLGPLRLGDLPQGKWRYLTDGEIAALKRAIRPPRRGKASGSARGKRGRSSHKGAKDAHRRQAKSRQERKGPDKT